MSEIVVFVARDTWRSLDPGQLGYDCVTRVDSLSNLANALARGTVCATLLDVSLLAAEGQPGTIPAHVPSDVPLILYVRLDRHALSTAFALARWETSIIVLEGVSSHETHSAIAAACKGVLERGLGARILPEVEVLLATMPRLLAANIRTLFGSGKIWTDVERFAHDSAMSRRTLTRVFHTAGLAPPHIMLAAAQFVRAYTAATNRKGPLCAIARAMQYESIRAMNRHAYRFCSRPMNALRADPDDGWVAESVVQLIVAGQRQRRGKMDSCAAFTSLSGRYQVDRVALAAG